MIRLICILAIMLLGLNNIIAQECLNVKFKIWGYFYAGTSKADEHAAGGFYEDQNRPKSIADNIKLISSPKDIFQIVVKTDSISELAEGILGFKVFVINATDSTVELEAQDSRLYLKRQVLYKNEWQDIEYLPSSWCGNSYHSVFINSQEYWEFTAPCLQGKIDAKCRFELVLKNGNRIYSNEFDGSFNKKQLSVEQGHEPLSLMDPYNN